jgi:hypothetical protein
MAAVAEFRGEYNPSNPYEETRLDVISAFGCVFDKGIPSDYTATLRDEGEKIMERLR